jgi:hypothetical protein
VRPAGSKIETAGGVFEVREDEPMPRVGATLHRTPSATGQSSFDRENAGSRMRQHAVFGTSSIYRVLRSQDGLGGLSDVSIGSDERGSPTAEHYRKTPKEIRQVARRSRFREIGDELFDPRRTVRSNGPSYQGDGIGGHVGLLRSISTVIFSLRQASLVTTSYAQPAIYRPTL